MNKIILLLFSIAFFMDFSFIPSLLGSKLSYPYFLVALIISVFLIGRKKYLISGVLAILGLNILLPANLFWHIVIVIVIWTVIYFFKNIFFDVEKNYLKRNFIFVIIFVLFNGLFFLTQYISVKILAGNSSIQTGIDWSRSLVRLLIGILIFNLIYRFIYKLCVKNTSALK